MPPIVEAEALSSSHPSSSTSPRKEQKRSISPRVTEVPVRQDTTDKLQHLA
jgi:hypothetical protein